MDSRAGVHQAERRGEQTLLRASLHRRNYALPGLLRGARLEELAFVEGRGPDSATRDSATATVEASIGGKWLELLSEVALGLERAAIVLNPDSGPYSAVMPSLTAVPG